MARILRTDALDEDGLAILRAAGHDVVDGTALEGAKRDEEIARAEAWVIRSGTRIAAADLAKATKLRAIARAGVGVDNVDLAAATARGVAVFHSPTGNITSAAEQAWALMLACARRVAEADASMKQGKWDRKLEGVELAGKTLFLVGLGRIGKMMAQRAAAFEMKVLGYDPFVTPEAAKAIRVHWVTVEDGLAQADVVSLHTPLTAQTRHLIDAKALVRMKPSAILVNAARGPLVDLVALKAALDAGKLRAAGIDVWEEEPPTDWSVAKHPRTVAAPHLGASTKEAQAKAAVQACERLAHFLASGDAGLAVNAQAAVDKDTRPWVALVESLAGFGVHLLLGPLEELVVAASAGLDPRALQVHSLVGALRASGDGEADVNAINAPGQANEKGWSFAGRVLPGSDEPKRIVLTLRAGKQTVTLEGTHTPHYGSRVTRLDGFDLEFRPTGRFLVTRHKDVPGVLARITASLAKHNVNVANVALARDHENGTALAVIQVDGSVPVAVRDDLRAAEAILEAHRVRVAG